MVFAAVSCGGDRTVGGTTSLIISGDPSADNDLHGITPFVESNVDSCFVSVNKKENDNVELLAIEDDTHIFEGWYMDDSLLISKDILAIVNLGATQYKDYIKDNTVTIRARFIEGVKVEFDLDGGSAPELVTKYDTSESDIELPMDGVNRHGYAFLGWKDSDGNIINAIPAGTKGRVTLTAEWIRSIGEHLIGRTWTVKSGMPFIEDRVPMEGMKSSLAIKFVDGERAMVYAEFDGEYVDMGCLYTQLIHNYDRMNVIRERAGDSFSLNRYNEWDYTAPRYNSGIGFSYEIENDKIYLYLTSEDEGYSYYIDNYFSWAIYALRYDGEFNIFFCSYTCEFDEKAFDKYLLMYDGMKPPRADRKLIYTDEYKCTDVTQIWESIYKECNMNIDEIGNKVLITEDDIVCYLSNSNMLSPAFALHLDDDGQKVYQLDSLIAIRNHLFATPFIVNTDYGYRTYFFSALDGMAYEFSATLENGDTVNVYYFISITDGSMITFFNETTKEFLDAMYEFCSVRATDSTWAESNYWIFRDYDFEDEPS